MYKIYMFKLLQLSKFLHGRRRTKLLSKLRTKSTVKTSVASRFLYFLQQEAKYRIDLHKTYCLFNSRLYGTGIRFSPNNLKRKARCGSDLLEYVQVNKIMQKLRKRKVRKHLKVLPRKVFQNRQACH